MVNKSGSKVDAENRLLQGQLNTSKLRARLGALRTERVDAIFREKVSLGIPRQSLQLPCGSLPGDARQVSLLDRAPRGLPGSMTVLETTRFIRAETLRSRR